MTSPSNLAPRFLVQMLVAVMFGVVVGWYFGVSSGSPIGAGGGLASSMQLRTILDKEVTLEFVPKPGEAPQIFEGSLHLKQSSGRDSNTADHGRGGGGGKDKQWFPKDSDKPSKTTTVFIGIPTAPGNAQKRNTIRQYCFPAYRVYPQVVGFGFFVGKPPLSNTKNKADLPMGDDTWLAATPEEIKIENALKAEAELHGDFYVEGFRDKYEDLTLKTMAIFEQGVRSGADIIVKVDDDMCLIVEQVLQLVDEALAGAEAAFGPDPKVEIYGGNDFIEWNGLGDTTPYQQGSAYFMSHNLAKTIFVTDREHTVLYGDYGHWAEDVNTGRWVHAAKERHNLTIMTPYNPLLIDDWTAKKWGRKSILEGTARTRARIMARAKAKWEAFKREHPDAKTAKNGENLAG